ncbi:MAG TPA: response regulator [Bacteroidota bacterium]|nr:response regulator [Bacteroidota bacterium]
MTEKVRILVVDDDPTTCTFMARLLAAETDHEIRKASGGEDALRDAEQYPPAIIITDLYMPGMDGLALCRAIRSRAELSDTMVMMLSAGRDVSERVGAFDAGADEYVVKPVQGDELVSRIRALLRIRSLREELRRDNGELARLNAALSENLSAVVGLLVHIISLRVPDAGTRSQRAGGMARWMGEHLGIEGAELDLLEMAARIHEIGKITLADELLRKQPSLLSAEERETIEQFPLFGSAMVGAVPQLHHAAVFIRHQLENYDGTGGPDRLMRDEIPLASMILRAINLIESLSAEPGHGTESVMDGIRKAQGTTLAARVSQLGAEYLTAIENPQWLEGKRQVQLGEIQEGMVIATDLCTSSGVKLIAAGTRLTSSQVERILAHNHSDPILHGVYVSA